MGSPSGAIRVTQRAVRPASQAVRGDGEAPGRGEGGPVVNLGNQIHPGGACRVSVMVGGKEQKWKWKCGNKEHIEENKNRFEMEM